MRKLVVPVFVGLCISFASALPAGAAFPGENGRIAFTAQSFEGHPQLGVWIARANGMDRRRISTHGVDASNPAWSPSGDRIAYTTETFELKRVIVAAPDGTHDRVVFERRSAEGGYFGLGKVAWSPSGRRLVFRTPKGLFVVHRDGTHLHRIGAPLDTQPAWSPNGRWIAVVRDRTERSFIVVMHPDGGDRRRVARGTAVYFPDWAPNSRSLAFQKSKDGALDLFIAPLAGSLIPLTHTSRFSESAPTWSPDGRWILYSRWKESSPFPFGDLWKRNPESGRAIRITHTPNVDEWVNDWRAV